MGLTLQSDTDMQIYFKLTGKKDDYSFTLDGEEVIPEDCGNRLYMVELKSISAGSLGKASELLIRKDEDTYSIKYGALSWAQSVLSCGKGQKKESTDMAKMIYRYAKAADAYFG
jgi:hypothetical protein